MDQDNFEIDSWMTKRDVIKRQFTIQCKDQCELLTLSIHDLDVMKNEFREAYMNLFENSFCNLRRTIQVKLKAIRYANKHLKLGTLNNDTIYKNSMTFKQQVTKFEKCQKKCNFEPIDQLELENSDEEFNTTSEEDEDLSESISHTSSDESCHSNSQKDNDISN